MEAAELLFNQVFRYFGIPEGIVSDRGPQFVSRVWRAFFTCLGVAVNLSSGYHPQTNGQTERKIQEINRYLRTFCHGHQDSWSQYLGWAEYAQNSLRQPSTGLTPFQCVLGYQPPLFPWSGEPSDVPAVDHWFRESKRVWGSAHHQLQRALRRRRLTADRRRSDTPAYQPGQKPVLPSTEPGEDAAEPPLPLLLDDGTAYGVKEILDSRCCGGRLEYLVDWEGYGPEERSWVPRDDVLDPDLLTTFHATHPHRPAPRGRGRPPQEWATLPPALLEGPRGVPRPAERHSLSSVSWVFPGATSRWGMSGTRLQGDVLEASETDARSTSTAPFDVEEQRLYYKLLPGDRAPYPISKGAPRHPTEEAHFGRLYPGSYPFGHDPELMTIG
ncbi:hypothetical protein QTP70_017100 [Hemibagrus guttatus]|uniref:Uncharacterized protein n=1 Tax=Hemibagrus guttatus TaxID=175788 RepID=A0AAE0VAD7_9TELE|nr:hypothetical protein QTP70_017100 [Hemibagrus guttatus]